MDDRLNNLDDSVEKLHQVIKLLSKSDDRIEIEVIEEVIEQLNRKIEVIDAINELRDSMYVTSDLSFGNDAGRTEL